MDRIHALPAITSRTHIIGILGITDPDPEGDGWFASDFCLFNRLFKGLGKSQTWLTSIDFGNATQRYGDILYGHPFEERKVVSSLADPHTGNVEVREEDELLDRFIQKLSVTYANADSGDRVLVLIFGHGYRTTHDVDIAGKNLTIDNFAAAVSPATTATMEKDLLVCVLMSSCFSGGWIRDTFNSSIMAAAPGDAESDSYKRSASGSYRGSVFTHGVSHELFESTSQSGAETSFQTFTDGVAARMNKLFSVGSSPNFSPQNSQWNGPLESTTGIPVEQDWKERYDGLPSVPANPHPDNISDHLFGGAGLIGRLHALCTFYEYLRPGRDTAAPNVWIHGQIASLRERRLSVDKAIILTQCLRYRVALAVIAEHYVDVLHLRPFCSFDMFELGEWNNQEPGTGEERSELLNSALHQIDAHRLFPEPNCTAVPKQRPFNKPPFFLAAAFASKGLDQLEVERRIREHLALEGGISREVLRRRVAKLSATGAV